MKGVERQSKTSQNLPIPFEFDATKYREKKANKNQKLDKRNISVTTNHLLVNFTPAERLKLHEYAIDQSKLLGYQVNIETFQYQENGFG